MPGATTTWLSVHEPASSREKTVAPNTRSPTSASSDNPSTTVVSAWRAAAILVWPPPAACAIDPDASSTSIIRP